MVCTFLMKELTAAKENEQYYSRSCGKQQGTRWECKPAFIQQESEKTLSLLNGLGGWGRGGFQPQEAQMSPVGSKHSHGKGEGHEANWMLIWDCTMTWRRDKVRVGLLAWLLGRPKRMMDAALILGTGKSGSVSKEEGLFHIFSN